MSVALLIIGLTLASPQIAWQLGVCDAYGCRSIGQPLPQQICQAMRDSLQRQGIERALCARVLVDQ